MSGAQSELWPGATRRPGLYEFTGYGRCKSCQASVEFWRTPTGATLLVNEQGEPLTQGTILDRDVAKDRLLALCHWGTCPNAKAHRKK